MPSETKQKRLAVAGRVTKPTYDSLKDDIRTYERTQDDVLEAALKQFFALKNAERKLILNRFPKKRLGRPICS